MATQTLRSTRGLIQSSLQRRFMYGTSLSSCSSIQVGWNKTAAATSSQSQHQQCISQILSRSLTYASVQHDVEYKHEMEGRHGEQLKLALEEAEKYQNEAIDPFELYKIDDVDMMDNIDNIDIKEGGEGIGNDEEGGNDEDEMEMDEIEEDQSILANYTPNGQLKRNKAELVALKAGSPAGGTFAIIDLNGSQQKVTIDDVVIVNKLKPVDKWAVGSVHTLTAQDGHVLLLGSQEKTLVGLPFVNGAEVDVMVEEITRDKKVIVFKKKRRKNYRRKNGHKREVTFLRVLDLRFPSS